MIYSKDQIKHVCTVIREDADQPIPISMEQEQLLTAMQHWVKTRVRTKRDIDPRLFTRDTAIAEAIKMINYVEEPIREKESDVKMPEKFKISSKWIVFSEIVDGQGQIPLNYIIHSLDVPLTGTVYETGLALGMSNGVAPSTAASDINFLGAKNGILSIERFYSQACIDPFIVICS